MACGGADLPQAVSFGDQRSRRAARLRRTTRRPIVSERVEAKGEGADAVQGLLRNSRREARCDAMPTSSRRIAGSRASITRRQQGKRRRGKIQVGQRSLRSAQGSGASARRTTSCAPAAIAPATNSAVRRRTRQTASDFDFGERRRGRGRLFSDFFESLFGRMARRQRAPARGPRRGRDLQRARSRFRSETAYHGGSERISLARCAAASARSRSAFRPASCRASRSGSRGRATPARAAAPRAI